MTKGGVTTEDLLVGGYAAVEAGRWSDAAAAFSRLLSTQESADAHFGLALTSWWQGENRASLDQCTRAYTLFRHTGQLERAVQCAVWLAITYKANFANHIAANGWLARAQRLLEPLALGPLHGWVWIGRAYQCPDLDEAEELTTRALDLAGSAGDVDLELVASSQLGLIRVAKGDTAAGFALLDQAMAAALAGEPSTLDTVVYTCCDTLRACELVNDIQRAAQWCAVADDFVKAYGCPFLYTECRIYYGSVLTATGRWEAAARELMAGARMSADASPGLHAKALTRLAGLRIRQGRLEEAAELLTELGQGVEAEAEEALTVAALLLARGEAGAAGRSLEQRLPRFRQHRLHLAAALDLLVDACLASGDIEAAEGAARHLGDLAADRADERLRASASGAQGRVLTARGDHGAAAARLEQAMAIWSRMDLPLELARTRFELARALTPTQPDVAVGHARRAFAGFDDLGAAGYADHVAAFLRPLGVTVRPGRRGVGSLTAREHEVLRLVGVGLSNPEIAVRLHVSRKTAAHHVSNILMKLHLRNRAEAAAYAVRGTSPDPP